MSLPGETYLGDGLYASYDGYQICLRTPREAGDHMVYLEPNVFHRLMLFERDLRTAMEKKGNDDEAAQGPPHHPTRRRRRGVGMNSYEAIRAFEHYQQGLKQGVVMQAREAAIQVLLTFITDLGHAGVADAFDTLMDRCAAVSKQTTAAQQKRRVLVGHDA